MLTHSLRPDLLQSCRGRLISSLALSRVKALYLSTWTLWLGLSMDVYSSPITNTAGMPWDFVRTYWRLHDELSMPALHPLAVSADTQATGSARPGCGNLRSASLLAMRAGTATTGVDQPAGQRRGGAAGHGVGRGQGHGPSGAEQYCGSLPSSCLLLWARLHQCHLHSHACFALAATPCPFSGRNAG